MQRIAKVDGDVHQSGFLVVLVSQFLRAPESVANRAVNNQAKATCVPLDAQVVCLRFCPDRSLRYRTDCTGDVWTIRVACLQNARPRMQIESSAQVIAPRFPWLAVFFTMRMA
jgi:hypothetical protein